MAGALQLRIDPRTDYCGEAVADRIAYITDRVAHEPRGKYSNLRHKFGVGDNELMREEWD
jgi:hypothetical protein